MGAGQAGAATQAPVAQRRRPSRREIKYRRPLQTAEYGVSTPGCGQLAPGEGAVRLTAPTRRLTEASDSSVPEHPVGYRLRSKLRKSNRCASRDRGWSPRRRDAVCGGGSRAALACWLCKSSPPPTAERTCKAAKSYLARAVSNHPHAANPHQRCAATR